MLQRLAVAFVVCSTIIVIFLHNPLSGWSILDTSRKESGWARPCTDAEREELRQTYRTANKAIPTGNGWSDAQIEKDVAACTVPEQAYLPFAQWSSNSPHLPWFGSVLNITSLLVTVTLLCLAVVLLFRRRPANTR